MRRAVAVGLVVLGATLMTVRGSFGGGQDEEIVFVSAANLIHTGRLALTPDSVADVAAHTSIWQDAVVQAGDGRYYAVYGPLQTFAATPLYLLGRLMAGSETGAARATVVRWVGGFNPIVTALTAALLTCWLLQLGCPRCVASAGGLGWALSGLAWPYAKTFLSEPLTALCYLAVVVTADRAARTARAEWAVASGLAGAAAVLTRPHNIVLLPILLLPLVLSGDRRDRVRRAIVACLPVVAACLWWLWFNQQRFGAPLDFGYQTGIQRDFALGNLPIGVAGQLVSPGRGLVFYVPWSLLIMAGFPVLQRREPAVAWVCLAACTGQLLFYSLRTTWWGNWCWGPRYLVPVLPLLAVLAAPAAELPRWRPWAWLLAGLGLVSAWAGLVVYNGLYQDAVFRSPGGLTKLLWSPFWSPLLGHWRYLFKGYVDLLLVRAIQLDPMVGCAGLLIRGAPGLLGLWLWRREMADAAS